MSFINSLNQEVNSNIMPNKRDSVSNNNLVNSLKIEIPYSFIKSKVLLTWNEIYFGIKYGFTPSGGNQ